SSAGSLRVEFSGFRLAKGKSGVESRAEKRGRGTSGFRCGIAVQQAATQRPASAGSHLRRVMGGGLCSLEFRIDGVALAVHNVAMKRIFYIGCAVGRLIEALGVGLVLGKKKFRRS